MFTVSCAREVLEAGSITFRAALVQVSNGTDQREIAKTVDLVLCPGNSHFAAAFHRVVERVVGRSRVSRGLLAGKFCALRPTRAIWLQRGIFTFCYTENSNFILS